MKSKNLFFLLVAAVIASCGKDNTNPSNPTTESYINTNAGSSWTYHSVDSSNATPQSVDYVITSTSDDTTVNGKEYHVYRYSYGGSQYLNLTGNDYYQFDTIPGGVGANVERLYLKDNAAVGTTWSQNFTLNIPDIPIPVSMTVSNNIVEKGISRTVNGMNYSNVIHVSTSLSSALIPPASFTSKIDSYYAEKYGLIENSTIIHIDYQGLVKDINIQTKLTGAVLK